MEHTQFLLRDLPLDQWQAFRRICRAEGKTASEALREFIAKTVEADAPPRLRRSLLEDGAS